MEDGIQTIYQRETTQYKYKWRVHSPFQIVSDFAEQVQKYYPSQPFFFVADSYYGSLEATYDLHYKQLGCLFSCKANMPSRLFKGIPSYNSYKINVERGA